MAMEVNMFMIAIFTESKYNSNYGSMYAIKLNQNKNNHSLKSHVYLFLITINRLCKNQSCNTA